MTRLSVLLLGIAILSLVSFSEAGPVQRYLHFRKADPPVKLDQPVPFFAELDVSETQYMFDELLSRISGCGVRLEWRSRSEFSGKQQETQQLQGAVLLVATGGPRAEEKEYFKNIPEGQNVVLVHPSDEYIMQSHPATYGEGVKQVFRNYYHVGMGNSSMQYLRQQAATAPTPKVLWMPLGLANLRVMPGALHYPFRERKHLWAWAGSFGDKPERSEMMDALKAHKMSAEVMSMGVLKTFGSYAGRPGSHSDAINIWEYSMLMHQTQFVPIPAGISAEQYRVWESFEAGNIPIILEKHVAPNSVLYPLQFLGFRYITVEAWQDLPDKLLELRDEMARHPKVYAAKQQHNSRLWVRVKDVVGAKIAQAICDGHIARPSRIGTADVEQS